MPLSRRLVRRRKRWLLRCLTDVEDDLESSRLSYLLRPYRNLTETVHIVLLASLVNISSAFACQLMGTPTFCKQVLASALPSQIWHQHFARDGNGIRYKCPKRR